MMYLNALWYLQLSLSLTASAWPTKRSKLPVCIIGAGPAGLSAASRLEEKGVKAVIFDKQATLGGKCQSYYDEKGIFHPMGAAFFSNATYTETLKVVNSSGVLAEPFALAGMRDQFRFNYTTGALEQVPALSTQFITGLMVEVSRYAGLWQKGFAPYSSPGFKKGVPDELAVSGAEWFRKNNFTALPLLLVNPLALYGYGDIRVVPAAYVLQYITPDLLTAFIGQHAVYYIDFHKVWVEFQKKKICKTPIHLSHEIRCIDRSGKHPVIKYTKPDATFYKWEKQECSSLIMAFPPTIDNLERTGLDLTKEEHDIFNNVITHNYFSSAVALKLPFGESYIANSSSIGAPPPNEGEPVAVLRLNTNTNVSTSWSWGPDATGPNGQFESESSARDLLNTTLSRVNKDPRNTTMKALALISADIRAFRKWDYFPHFGTGPLRNNIYAKLNKLQGCKNTYYASGLQGMETVEWAIRAGKDVVDSYLLRDGWLQ